MSGFLNLLMAGKKQPQGVIAVGAEFPFIGYGFGPSTANDPVGSCTGDGCSPACASGTGYFVGDYDNQSRDFVVLWSAASGVQSCFTGVRVLDRFGTVRTYLTASATFNNSGQTSWAWGDGSSKVWLGGETARTVEFF